MSDHVQENRRFLGMESSSAFAPKPEGGGCNERYLRTLKDQLVRVRHFQNLDAIKPALGDFRDRHNR